MEPLAALSLTSNIVQIVDFGFKVALKCRELYKNGETAENKDIEVMAKRLINLCADLHISEITNDPQIQMNLEEDERAIQELAQSCSETAKDLIAEIVHLKIDRYHKKSGTIRKTFKAIRVSSKIKDIQMRLK